MTIRYPLEPGDPWIWLQEDEGEGTADCGCHLIMDNGAKFSFCTMHAAAEELLATLVNVVNLPTLSGSARGRSLLLDIHQTIALARGGTA